MCGRHRLYAAALVGFALGCAPAHGQPRAGAEGRLRAPSEFSCNPNDLTSYTGVVVRYERSRDQTTLRIHTDAETMETVTLKHPGTDDPSSQFRYAGRPFTAADWARIEQSKGVLRPSTRATAWVCSNGRLMIDWAAAKE